MKTLLTPESIPGSGSCVQLRAPGDLYIQSTDAYGFQRELILKNNERDSMLHSYQHPGRREVRVLTVNSGRKLMAALLARAEFNPGRLFNEASVARAKNYGFVQFHEACFRGTDTAVLLEMI